MGRLLQGHFMQNYYIDGEIADCSSILIHQGNKTIDARELYEIRTKITFYTLETFFTHVVQANNAKIGVVWEKCGT